MRRKSTSAPMGTTGSSPSHDRAGEGLLGAGRGQATPREPEPPVRLDELLVADSFIMDVLRGWHLLQAAGLTPEEKSDILSMTKNSLDYSMIFVSLELRPPTQPTTWTTFLRTSSTTPSTIWGWHEHDGYYTDAYEPKTWWEDE